MTAESCEDCSSGILTELTASTGIERDDAPISVTASATPSYRIVTIGMVALVCLIAYQSLAVTTAMPSVAKALDGLSLYAMAFALPMAAGVVGMVMAGNWSDRRGPAAPLWTGVGLFVAGMLLVGLAPSMETVVLGRMVQGLGSGMLLVALYVVIGRVYPESMQPGVFAALSAAWVVPSLIGPTIAGSMVEHIGWRWVFLSIPFLALPAALLVRPALNWLHDTPLKPLSDADLAQRRRRLLWALGAAVSAVALHYGGQQTALAGIALIGVGLIGLALSAPKLLPHGTLRAGRGLPSVIALRSLIGSAFFGAEIYLPLLLSRERDFSPAMAGAILTIGGVTWFSGSWLRGRPSLQRSPAIFIGAGAISLTIGIAAAALLVWNSVPVLVGVLGWSFAGFGMGLAYPSLSMLTLQLSATGEEGTNSSSLQVGEALAVAAVLALTGSLFAALEDSSPSLSYLICFGTAIALSTSAAVLSGRVAVEPSGAQAGIEGVAQAVS